MHNDLTKKNQIKSEYENGLSTPEWKTFPTTKK